MSEVLLVFLLFFFVIASTALFFCGYMIGRFTSIDIFKEMRGL